MRCLVRQRRREAATLKSWGCELATGDVTDAGEPAARPRRLRHRRPPRRDHRGKPADFERVMVEGTQNVLAAAKEAGVRRVVLMSALGTSEETQGPRAVLRREVGDGAGDEGVGARARDLPAELRLRPRRRRAPALRPPGALVARDPGGRRRRAAAPADLGRRRRRLLRQGGRPARGGEPDVRARRARPRDLERALRADRAHARQAARTACTSRSG